MNNQDALGDEQFVKLKWPEAYETVDGFIWEHQSKVVHGAPPLLGVNWAAAASRLRAEEGQHDDECVGEPCWRNPETGYIEYCKKHEGIMADRAMEAEAARDPKPTSSPLGRQETDLQKTLRTGYGSSIVITAADAAAGEARSERMVG